MIEKLIQKLGVSMIQFTRHEQSSVTARVFEDSGALKVGSGNTAEAAIRAARLDKRIGELKGSEAVLESKQAATSGSLHQLRIAVAELERGLEQLRQNPPRLKPDVEDLRRRADIALTRFAQLEDRLDAITGVASGPQVGITREDMDGLIHNLQHSGFPTNTAAMNWLFDQRRKMR